MPLLCKPHALSQVIGIVIITANNKKVTIKNYVVFTNQFSSIILNFYNVLFNLCSIFYAIATQTTHPITSDRYSDRCQQLQSAI